MTLPETLLVAAVTGTVQGLITFSAMRTDITWLKSTVSRAHLRIDALQDKILNSRG